MRTILLLLIALVANPVAAQSITCKENVMTSNRFCSSKSVRVGSNYYFFATDDTGVKPNILFSFGGLVSASRPDGVVVKLDSAEPFKVEASGLRPDVSCFRRSCVWSVSAAAKPTVEHFAAIGRASRMLVSFTESAYVSDPMEVDPRQVSSWHSEWLNLTGRGPALTVPAPDAADSPSYVEAPPATSIERDPAKRCDACGKLGTP